MQSIRTRSAFSRLLHSTLPRRLTTSAMVLSLLTPLAAIPTPLFASGCAADLTGDDVVNAADLSILLGAWGTPGGPGSPDLDGDGAVGGADLASLLGAWGPCPVVCGGFTPMAFATEPIPLDELGIGGSVILDGFIDVAPFGAPSGSLTVTFPSGFVAVIEMHPGATTISTADVVLELVPFAPPGAVLVDSVITPTAAVLSAFETDVASGLPFADWSPTSRATMALTALSTTDVWACNIAAAKLAPVDGLQGQGFWCKTAAYAAATAITVLATTGCAALTAGCATATTVTIGGMALPCTWLIGLCAGGVFVGAAAAYEGSLALWGDEQD